MSISAEAIAQRASERFMLVRLTPARYIGPDLALSAGVYQMDWTYPVARVERNGVALTAVDVTPSSNDTYQWDESAGTLKVKLASAPSTTNVIVVYYYLFYTSRKTRDAHTTPTDTSTTLRTWEPRMREDPVARQSVKNLLTGVLSYEANGLVLINTDNTFQDYLTATDSFYLKDVDMWLCVDSTDDIEHVYRGKVNTVKVEKTLVRLGFVDLFNRLEQPALMGDTIDEAYFYRSADSFEDLDPSKHGVPCKLIIGYASRYEVRMRVGSGTSRIDDLSPDWLQNFEEGVNISFDPTVIGTTNRTWGLCRIRSPLKVPTIGTISYIEVSRVFAPTNIEYIALFDEHTLMSLDPLKVTTGGTAYYAVAGTVTDWSEGGDDFNLQMTSIEAHLKAGLFSTINAGLASTYHETNKSLCVILYKGDTGDAYYLAEGRDYTVTETSTSGGNYFVSIELLDNFEGNLAGNPDADHPEITTLDPAVDRIFYRVATSAPENHAEALQAILEAAGLTVNQDSFDDAAAALTTEAMFSIPFCDETSYGTYRDYAEALLASTVGIVRMNTSQEVEYHLLAAPAPEDTIDNNTVLRGSFLIDVDYNDIVTEIRTYNPHNPATREIAATPSPNVTASSEVVKHLHDLEKPILFRHVLRTYDDVIDRLFAVRSSRRAVYHFDTATENLGTQIGDDVTLEGAVLGSSGSVGLKVLGVDKGTKRTSVVASDLEDL